MFRKCWEQIAAVSPDELDHALPGRLVLHPLQHGKPQGSAVGQPQDQQRAGHPFQVLHQFALRAQPPADFATLPALLVLGRGDQGVAHGTVARLEQFVELRHRTRAGGLLPLHAAGRFDQLSRFDDQPHPG